MLSNREGEKMKVDFRLNDGLRGWDDKTFGLGISLWNNPVEMYLELGFWTLNLKTEWRGIKKGFWEVKNEPNRA